MTSTVRKLCIDSRPCDGTPSDFTFQLPQGVPTDNTIGIVLSQLSMPNAFNSVMADFNDMLYFGLDLVNVPGIFAGRNDRVFVRATSLNDGFVDDRIITLPPGLDIAMTWLAILQTALRTVWAAWTVQYDLPTGSNQILTPGYLTPGYPVPGGHHEPDLGAGSVERPSLRLAEQSRHQQTLPVR